MLQQINLYDRLPKIQTGWPDVTFIVRSSIGLLVFLIFLHFVHKWQLSNIDTQLQKLTAEQVSLTDQLTDLTRRYPLASQSGGIEKIMHEIPLQIKEKQKILNELANSARFSQYLEGLAQIAVNGIWLTEIDFDHGGTDLTLKGRAKNPDDVNQFMKNIVANDIFNGKKFRVFNISQPRQEKNQPNKTYIEFYISTLDYSDETNRATSNPSSPDSPNDNNEIIPPVDASTDAPAKIPPATVQEPSSATPVPSTP